MAVGGAPLPVGIAERLVEGHVGSLLGLFDPRLELGRFLLELAEILVSGFGLPVRHDLGLPWRDGARTPVAFGRLPAAQSSSAARATRRAGAAARIVLLPAPLLADGRKSVA